MSLAKFAKLDKPSKRRGFTLVEMLVVIAIIGALVGLVAYYLPDILKGSRVKAMVVEIEDIAKAMNAYKSEHGGAYPPCMADINITARKQRFMRHIQVAFANSNYGTAAGNFDNLANGLRTGNATFTQQPYNFKDTETGDLRPLDLNTLDQAEALVFWLGGMPTPYETKSATSVANRRIFGFHRDPDSPFKRDTLQQEGADPLRYRTEVLYNFKDGRLVDQDNDGWFEYLPTDPSSGSSIAPLVYFDADSYSTVGTQTATAMNIQIYGYPRPDNPDAASLASRWGTAAPMAAYIDDTNTAPMRWQRPDSFQLLCAGADGKFSAPLTSDIYQSLRVIVYPKGQAYDRATNFNKPSPITKEEEDNINNLGSTTLIQARQTADK